MRTIQSEECQVAKQARAPDQEFSDRDREGGDFGIPAIAARCRAVSHDTVTERTRQGNQRLVTDCFN
jgi:hypothetical protein